MGKMLLSLLYKKGFKMGRGKKSHYKKKRRRRRINSRLRSRQLKKIMP